VWFLPAAWQNPFARNMNLCKSLYVIPNEGRLNTSAKARHSFTYWWKTWYL